MGAFAGHLDFIATVQHTLIRADGTTLELPPDTRIIRKPVSFFRMCWERLRAELPFFASMSFMAFLGWITRNPEHGMQMMAIVTSSGMTYLATAFTSVSNPINNFNFHTYGTGGVQGSTGTPTAATNATPIVVTQAGHPFFTNDLATIAGVTGNTGANGNWQLSPVTSTTYTLLGSVGNGVFGGSATSQRLNGQADTALTTEVSGLARVAGTQTNPSSLVYRTVATVPFTSTTPPLTIIEWGLFSASSSGTLWDRRWMNTGNAPSTTGAASLTSAPITITQVTDSIQTTYNLTVTAGGS